MKSSKFLWLTHPGTNSRPLHDVIVLENEHFVAMPSLGALVDFWLVVVPKRPMATLSGLNNNERTSLNDLRVKVKSRAHKITAGEALYEFEHGGVYGSVVSCGVDQAHLHMAYLPFDLIDVCKASEMVWRASCDVSALSCISTGMSDYLFLQRGEERLIANPSVPTSQWFRQVIATSLGSADWDYKRVPNHARINQMASEFGVAV